MNPNDLDDGLQKLKRFFKENLGAPFIIFFQILLFMCAILVVLNKTGIIRQILVYALYLLLIGVLLQTISFISKRK